MKYISVCSGIEAASVAWHDIPNWEPAWFSEIEKFPSLVLAHRFPGVKNLGDMTKFKEWPDEKIDLIVGGTPCQSFSVAGLRKGLADPRGNLMLTYLALADRYKPKWLLWENVPGVLSSNGGKDFGTFLGALGEIGYGWSYRVLDAQYTGVPQRRRRVFVVGHFGDWRPAAAVLFEPQSLRWNTPPSREKGQRVAPTVSQGAPFSCTGNERAEAMVVQGFETGPGGNKFTDVAPTLDCRAKNGPIQNQLGMGVFYPAEHAGYKAGVGSLRSSGGDCGGGSEMLITGLVPDVANTLTRRMHKGINSTVDEGQTPIVEMAIPINTMVLMDQGGSVMDVLTDGSVGTLRAQTHGHEPIAIHPHVVGRGPNSGPQGKEYLLDGSAYCQDSRGVPQAVAFQQNQMGEVRTGEVAGTLNQNSNPSGRNTPMIAFSTNARPDEMKFEEVSTLTKSQTAGVATEMVVRRLTPQECERLQGFPDGWTDIPVKVKTDAPEGSGPCVKQVVKATVMDIKGNHYVGTNYCSTPKDTCARAGMASGVGYELCKSVCNQPAHAEVNAIKLAGKKCVGATLYLEGHTYACEPCLAACKAAGIVRVVIGTPPGNAADGPRYKSLGNSMAVPCMIFIGRRIDMVDKMLTDMAKPVTTSVSEKDAF